MTPGPGPASAPSGRRGARPTPHVGTRRLTVHRAGVDLAVDVPDGDGPAVVVAHGAGSQARFVRDAFVPRWSAAGWRVVTYDLRGHARSGPAPDPSAHALAHHVADLAAVVDVVGAEVTGGVSLGAHVAVAHATDTPTLRGVVACLPAWTGRSVPGSGFHAAVASAVRDRGIAALAADIGRDRTLVPWLRAVLARDWAAHDPDSLAAALIALDGSAAPSVRDLASLHAPLGVVGWPDDAAHPLDVAETWAAVAPRGALAVTSMTACAEPGVLGAAALDALGRATD